MDDLWWVLLLCACMFFGSFVAGNIPLMAHLSEERMRSVSTFGAGILVGVALVVILPEGVEQVYAHQFHMLLSPLSPPSPSADSAAGAGAGVASEPVSATALTGFSLLAGFVAMLLVEQLAPGHTPHQGHLREHSGFVAPSSPLPSLDFRITATFLGILVHAAADGIAFGGASAGQNKGLEMIVFAAIMVHKAPAAFGMTSVLLAQGYTRKAVRQMLLLFSATAPLAATLTYAAVLGAGAGLGAGMPWTGIVLLFSAGSFLYVAVVHVLPDALRASTQGAAAGDSSAAGHAHAHALPRSELLLLLLGMVAPMAAQVGHAH